MVAHAANVSSQIGRLLELVAGRSFKDAESFKESKAAVARILQDRQYPRVDQFATFTALEGLVEKCQIFGLEDLAEALQDRTELLQRKDFKYLPEVLSLLLNLSHRPTENKRLREINGHGQQYQQPGDSQDISESTDNLWTNPYDDIDYNQSSSDLGSIGGSYTSSDVSYQSVHSSAPVSEEAREDLYRYVVPVDASGLSNIRNKLCGLKGLKVVAEVSELYVIRQILNMLRGLPSSLFNFPNGEVEMVPAASVTLSNVDVDTLSSALHSFGQAGLTMQKLRAYLSETHTTYTAQALADSIQDVVAGFNIIVFDLESIVVKSNQTTALTILAVLKDINKAIKLPQILQQVLGSIKDKPKVFSVSLLDGLYESTCIAQDALNSELYCDVRKIFHRCLNGYLSSVAKWTLQGQLDENEPYFFVKRRKNNTALSDIWHNTYEIRKLNERVFAPGCLKPAIAHLFNIGKDVALLKGLKLQEGSDFSSEGTLATADIFREGIANSEASIVPFQVHFLNSLKNGPLLQTRDTSQQLCQYLLYDCNGWKTMQALLIVYLAQDFQQFSQVSDCLWDALRLAATKEEVDCDLLTSNTREALESVNQLAGSTVRVLWPHSKRASAEGSLQLLSRMTLVFEYGEPVKTIIKPESLPVYQGAFRLLLQLYFCSSAISRSLPQSVKTNDRVGRTSLIHLSPSGYESGVALSLRFNLLWFLHILKDHFFNVVINPSKATLQYRWSDATDVNGLDKAYEDFKSSLATGLFQREGDSPIQRILIAIFDLALSFHAMTCTKTPRLSNDHHKLSNGRFQCKWHLSSSENSTASDLNGLRRMYKQFKNLLKLLIGALREKAREEKQEDLAYLVDRLANDGDNNGMGA